MKRSATTPISNRRTKKAKVSPISILAPEHRDIAKTIFGFLPLKDKVHFSQTCKEAQEQYKQDKKDYLKEYELFDEATKEESFEAKPEDYLTINVAVFLDIERTKAKFGKVKHVHIRPDGLEIGEKELFRNLSSMFPDLEYLDIYGSYYIPLTDIGKSVKKIRIHLDNQNSIRKYPVDIKLEHNLEELCVFGHKETPVYLQGGKIQKVHGQCKLIRGSVERDSNTTYLVKGKILSF